MKLKIWIRSSNELQIPATPNIPNQTTNNEAMEKVLKKLWKTKIGLAQNLSVPINWYQEEP